MSIRRSRLHMSKAASQMPLPLDWGADKNTQFIVGRANEAAVLRLSGTRHAGEAVSHAVILVGPPRCGKSALGENAVQSGQFSFLDDADDLADEKLFHGWNRAKQEGLTLLLASHHMPAEWKIDLPDLKSRLAQAEMLVINEPDEDMLAALIGSHLARFGTSISEDALAYILARLERTHVMAEQFAKSVNARSLALKQPINLSLVRDYWQQYEAEAQCRFPDISDQ